jgi:uncharacterized membrane protein
MWDLRRSRERGSVNRIALPLLFLILVGSLLRFPSLEHESLWFDELAQWFRSSTPDLNTVIEQGVRPNVDSPGLTVLLFFVIKYLGDSELALRFPSAVAGVLAIPMMYLLAARLYSYKEGLIAAALTAVAWCSIYYSQEARAYSLLLLFSILTSYLWISMMGAFQRGDSPPYITMGLYLVAATVCAYLHYFGLYLVALQGLAAGVIFIKKPRALLKISVIYIALAVLYLPWLPMMLEDLGGGKLSWVEPPEISSFVFYLRFLFNESPLLLTVVVGLYLYLLIQSLEAKGESVREIDPLSPGLLLPLWLVIPFLGAYIKSVVSTPVLVFRYLIISLPPAYILLSRAITRLPFKAKTQMAVALILVGLFLGDLVLVQHYYSLPHKQQWREAVAYIVERNPLYENSLIIRCGSRKEFLNYYFSRMDSPRGVEHLACQKQDITKTMRVIDSKNPSYIWFIRIWSLGTEKPGGEFLDFLKQNFRTLEHRQFLGVAVWLFEVTPP